MPEILPNHVPSPRTLLAWDGTAYRPITIDAAGHVQIDVLTSGLPAGAATAAHQVTQNTALQLIDNLVNALQSVHTDRLKVRGENQLFSVSNVLALAKAAAISGAGGFLDTTPVTAGEYWVVTTIVAGDNTNPVTRIVMNNRHNGTNVTIKDETAAFAVGIRSVWQGFTLLDASDTIRCDYVGALAGDIVAIDITGYSMTLEV